MRERTEPRGLLSEKEFVAHRHGLEKERQLVLRLHRLLVFAHPGQLVLVRRAIGLEGRHLLHVLDRLVERLLAHGRQRDGVSRVGVCEAQPDGSEPGQPAARAVGSKARPLATRSSRLRPHE